MKLKQKLMASIVTVMMLTSYVATLTNAVIAVGEELSNQNSKTNHANVEFNSYFEGEKHSATFEIGKEAKLYLNLKISNMGYLKNGVVQLEDANFEIDTTNFKSDKVQSSTKNEIKLKQINNNEAAIIEVPIMMQSGETVDSNIFNKTAKINFTGTYLDENGEEKFIQKEIKNQVKWEGTAEIQLAGEVSKYTPYKLAEEQGLLIQVKIASNLKDNSLPIAKTKLEVDVPEVANAKPSRMTVIANSTKATNGKINSEVNYTYNQESNKLEIEVENNEQNGKIAWNKNAVDEYLVNYIYTGEEVYNQVQQTLEKAKSSIKTEEEIKEGKINENAIIGEIGVKAEIQAYNSKETNVVAEGKINYSIEQEKGKIIDISIDAEEKISKGYIYANYAKSEKEAKKEEIEEKKETDYNVNYTAQVYDKTLIEYLEFVTSAEKYIDEEEQEYATKAENIYTKTIKISEENFNKMLGEEGKIEIKDRKENKLAEITKDTTKDQNGNYVVDLSQEKVNEISIKTSKPVTEGKIIISAEKAITGKQEYTKSEMEMIRAIKTEITVKDYGTQTFHIELTEPVSKAEISIGEQNLSTTVENTDVELRTVLDTSTLESALFKNPVLQIILPENIERLNIKSVDLLLEDELKIKETKIEEANGRKIIKITLNGMQTKYMNNDTQSKEQENIISKGANIVIKANITFKKLTPSANTNIYLYYTNENTDLFEQYYKKPETNRKIAKQNSRASTQEAIGVAKTEVKVVAPNGVITENSMSGFKENENIQNVTAEKQEAKIDSHVDAKQLTIGGTIVNNYNNNIEHVCILGRIPFSGNKQIDTNQELGSNFTMPMKEKIAISGIDESRIKIYYSANPEANQNLTDANNSWTEEPTNLAEVKSYLIAISGEVEKGTQLNFDYKAELPADLKYNQNSYTTYKVYYDNKMVDATLEETKQAGIIGLTTGQGPELQVSVTSNSKTAREGQIVTMTATIKNVGGITAENAKLLITAPENTVHTEQGQSSNYYYEDSSDAEKEISLGNIKAGETVTKTYELKINKLVKETDISDEQGSGANNPQFVFPGEKDIVNIVRVSAINMTGQIKSNEYKIRIQEGDLSIVSSNDHIDKNIKNADTVTYMVEVKNIANNKELNNITVTIPIPETMKVKEAYYTYNTTPKEEKKDNIAISTNNVTVNLGSLKTYNSLEEKNGMLKDTANITIRLTSQGFKGSFEYVVKAKADGIQEHQSNSNTMIGKETKLSVEAKLNNKYITENSEFTYKVIVKNEGEAFTINNKVDVMVPEGTTLVKASYKYNGETKTKTADVKGKVTLDIYKIEPGDTIEITVTAKAEKLSDENNKEITIGASVEASGVEKVESNKLKAIIEYDENEHPGGSSWNKNPNENGEETTSRYKITGTAWIDENKDGKRDEAEKILPGVQVILLYKSNSQVVKDETTGAEKITTTNSEGKYEFTRLKPNEYLVLFLYDAGKYSITDYQKEGVEETLNSDATSMKIVLNGEKRQAGVSNTIKIINQHVRDIDIGLFEAENFDLRLDKYISKVTVKTPSNGTKEYHYNNSKITKREIAGKDIGKTQLVVEYKIVVTNEGRVEGYVKKIADYLPKDINFSSELNPDWYISNDNSTVYNTSLENEKILPGQSKQVKLVLSINITEKNISKLMNNNAEIYESYNELGLEDIDSIPANKLEVEDDMSNADIIISVATGRNILYITLAFGIIMLLGIGIYEIKKRVLVKKTM